MIDEKTTPDNISKDDMKKLANHIEEYLELFLDVMVIPDELIEDEKKVNEAVKRVRKLIKKLKKGDKSVFKDEDEWNLLP